MLTRKDALARIDEIKDEIVAEKDILESCEESEKEYHIARIAELEGFIEHITEQYHNQFEE